MTQEHKDLLMRDLSARLPYGVKVNNEIQGDFTVYGICENFIYGRSEVCHIDFAVENVKPYLFPMSSMTEEQENEYVATFVTIVYEDGSRDNTMTCESFDWLNKHMFDYRGLIQLGLAKDATGLGIY